MMLDAFDRMMESASRQIAQRSSRRTRGVSVTGFCSTMSTVASPGP